MKIPSTNSIIYKSLSDELIEIRLTNYLSCKCEISCDNFKDSVILNLGMGHIPNERVIIVKTNAKDVYGWSDGDVDCDIREYLTH